MASQEDIDQSKDPQITLKPNGFAPGNGASGTLDSDKPPPDDPQKPTLALHVASAVGQQVLAAQRTASDLASLTEADAQAVNNVTPQDSAGEFQKKFVQIIDDLTKNKIDDANAVGFFKKSGVPQQVSWRG